MTARLLLTTDNTTTPFLDPLKQYLSNSFTGLISRMDYTTGTMTENIRWTSDTGYAESSAPGGLVPVGAMNGQTVYEDSTLQAILGTAIGATDANLYVALPWATNAFATAANPNPVWLGDGARANAHEILHMLGNDYSLYNRGSNTPGTAYTTYDLNVSIMGGRPFWIGANAEALYGGPVPLDVSIDHTYFGPPAATPSNVHNLGSIMDNYQPWTSTVMTGLDLAMMQDDGVPVLTDNQLHEHTAIRLFDALGHHVSEQTLSHFINAGDVYQIARAILNNGYAGNATDQQFLASVYQHSTGSAIDPETQSAWLNALSVGATTRTDILVNFGDGDAHRHIANANPNAFYAGSMEEEITRLGDMATGTAPDPTQYAAMLHTLSVGGSMHDIAMTFMADPREAAHYVGATSDSAFINALFANAHDTNAAEKATDLRLLSAHQISRPDLMVVLSDTPQHIAYMAALPDTHVGGSPNGVIQLIGMVATLPANHEGSFT